jgi:radical SAM family uncharacterized protein
MPMPTLTDPGSIRERLQPLLGQVAGPIQYLGGEVGSRSKDWQSVAVHWALLFPDAYEVAVANLGVQILYEILNERDDALAERAYTPLPDFEQLLRQADLPAFSVETHRPLKAFDVIGVSLATELGFTNLLTTLDLAKIALRAQDRGPADPLVIAGGHCAFNPEPLAPFLDAVVLGDGEEAVGLVTEQIISWQQASRPGGRAGLLRRLAVNHLAYVPSLYNVTYASDGQIAALTPTDPQVPPKVAKHLLLDLDDWPYPKAPVVPYLTAVHERASLEIFRGCTRGCRFCQAGMVTRPVRERSADCLAAMADCCLSATGYEEIGLLSLSSSDHSEIAELTNQLAKRYAPRGIGLSLPSTRIDAFDIDLAQTLASGGRRPGLTFAPEGGSARLRDVINKQVTEADLLRTVETAFAAGWRSVKLYFMCGLPTETDADVVAIADLARQVVLRGRQVTGRRDVACTVSIGAFVPKPHTPFQWAAQTSAEVVNQRLAMLKEVIWADAATRRAIKLRRSSPRQAQLEGLLARGDRRVAEVIELAWRRGARFDGWREHLDLERWEQAAADALTPLGIDANWFTSRQRQRAEVLPWDHLDSGVDRDWLWADWCAALEAETIADCRWSGCADCGVCPGLGGQIQLSVERSKGVD